MQNCEQKHYFLCECKKSGHNYQKDFPCNFSTFDRDMTMFHYDFFELAKSSNIPGIYHNFVLFFRKINYWNSINKRVADEYFELLDLNKHYFCKHF